MKQGKLVIISGPSGVGKTTIVKRLLESTQGKLVKSISATTRPPRPQEANGKEYYFYTPEQFRESIKKGEFLEYAEIFGYLYGTPKKRLEEALAQGKIVLLEIDVQGTQSVKKLGLDCLCIFIQPPDMKELERRLTGRKSNSPTDTQIRLKTSQTEMNQKNIYDFCIVNDTVDSAVGKIKDALSEKGIL